MTLYGPLETDARVLRSIDAALAAGCNVTIITCNTTKAFLKDKTYKIINMPYEALGALNYMRFCKDCLKWYLELKKDIDVIYLHDYYSTAIGNILKPFAGKRSMVYDAHELILLTSGQKTCSRDKFFIWAERKLLNKVKLIIEANKERENIFRERYGVQHTTYVLNVSKFHAVEPRTYDPSNKVIVYQGKLTEERNLSFFIKAMKSLPEVKLLMIGGGHDLPIYQKMVEEYGLQHQVSFTGRLSNEDMMEKMKSCSIGIISYPFSNLNNIYCSPNKIFEYAAISLPFIATAQPFIKEVQDTYHIGRTYEYGNIESFKDNIEAIFEDYKSYNRNSAKFIDDYSFDKQFAKLVEIFEKI